MMRTTTRSLTAVTLLAAGCTGSPIVDEQTRGEIIELSLRTVTGARYEPDARVPSNLAQLQAEYDAREQEARALEGREPEKPASLQTPAAVKVQVEINLHLDIGSEYVTGTLASAGPDVIAVPAGARGASPKKVLALFKVGERALSCLGDRDAVELSDDRGHSIALDGEARKVLLWAFDSTEAGEGG